MPSGSYDVFISYNSKETAAVHQVAQILRDRHGLQVWLDAWVLPPGQPWHDHIEQGLRDSKSVAVFVGPAGIGAWEMPEMRAAFDRLVKERTPVIPVLLPGALDREDGKAHLEDVLPTFLRSLRAVDLAAGLEDERGLALLRWGITGQNPLAAAAPALQPAAAARPASSTAQVVDEIAEEISAGDVTFLLGRSFAGAQHPKPPPPCELSARLLRELCLVSDTYEGLIPGVETVASMLQATRGEPLLERFVLNLIDDAGASESGVHAALARLMRLLGRRPAARRPRRRAPRLILSTNYDLLMERALLRAGLPFTRLVQFRAEPRIDVSVFDDVNLAAGGAVLVQGERIDAADGAGLDGVVYDRPSKTLRADVTDGTGGNPIASLPIDQFPDPILYKFQGSQDIKRSCTISADQCLDFAWRLLQQECVPNQLSQIIGNGTLIALGVSILDHDFRLTYHTLLRRPLEISQSSRYVIGSRAEGDRRDPHFQLAGREWDKIQENALRNFGLKSIDAAPQELLTRLTARLEQDWGSGS